MPSDTILFYEDYEAERPRRLTVPPGTDYLGYLTQYWGIYQDGDIPLIPTEAFNVREQAFVNHGRWCWQCEVCNSAYPVSNSAVFSICVVCGDDWRQVVLPDDVEGIQDTLKTMPGHRYNAPVRNWHPNWPEGMLAERARIAIEKQKAQKGTLVGLSIRTTRTWLVGEILSATNMNTYVSGTDDDLAGRNGPVEFENSIEVNDGDGRYIELPTGAPPSTPRSGMIHNLTGQNRPAFFGTVWNAVSFLTDVTFGRLMANGDIGAAADQLIKGDHDHTGSSEGTLIPSGGLVANSVRLQELAHATGDRVLGYDSAGAPAVVRANRVSWGIIGQAQPTGARQDDMHVSRMGWGDELASVAVTTWQGLAANSSRVIAKSSGEARFYDFDLNEQAGEAFSLPSASGISATDTLVFILGFSSGSNFIRAYNIASGNQDSGETISSAGSPSFTPTDIAYYNGKHYVLSNSDNAIYVFAADGTRQTAETISLPSSRTYTALEVADGLAFVWDSSSSSPIRRVRTFTLTGTEIVLGRSGYTNSTATSGLALAGGSSFLTLGNNIRKLSYSVISFARYDNVVGEWVETTI